MRLVHFVFAKQSRRFYLHCKLLRAKLSLPYTGLRYEASPLPLAFYSPVLLPSLASSPDDSFVTRPWGGTEPATASEMTIRVQWRRQVNSARNYCEGEGSTRPKKGQPRRGGRRRRRATTKTKTNQRQPNPLVFVAIQNSR